MISQFYILSPRGDKVISRDYRGDISRETNEIFFRKVKFWKGDPPPVFNFEGVNFVYLKKSSLYFVLTTRYNTSPSLLLELILRITRLFKDYCGTLSEESIRKNTVLLYELLDEIIDFGHIQGASTESLKSYIFNEPVLVADKTILDKLSDMKIAGSTSVSSTAANQSVVSRDTKNKKNEVFIDILERINVVFNSTGNIVTCEIDGSIIMKSFLAGNPQICLGLNEDLAVGKESGKRSYGAIVIDDCNFHEVVKLDEFETDRQLVFVPPDGECTLMNYRITGEYCNMPFRIYPFIDQVGPYKMELVLKVRADLPTSSYASNVFVTFNVPKISSGVSVEFGSQATGQSYEYKQNDKKVIWAIKKFTGGSEHMCRAKITLASPATVNTKKEIGPVSMKFEIPMHNVSGVQVRFLRVDDRSKAEPPARWVRYITQAHSYVCRV